MTEDADWTGGCLCGKRRYRFARPPSTSGYCHCSMCRRATGGPFAVLVRVDEDDLEWLSEPPATFRSSPIAKRGFCPDCGTPLFLRYDDDDRIRLTAGSLDHPERITPSYNYGIESRLPWVCYDDDLPGQPTQERF
ncbi:GFA family protein [Phyllobacterium phragmitis]